MDLIPFLLGVVLKFNFAFGIGNTFEGFRNQNSRNRNTLSLTPIPVFPVGVPFPSWASAFISVFYQVSLYTIPYTSMKYIFNYPSVECLGFSGFIWVITYAVNIFCTDFLHMCVNISVGKILISKIAGTKDI